MKNLLLQGLPPRVKRLVSTFCQCFDNVKAVGQKKTFKRGSVITLRGYI